MICIAHQLVLVRYFFTYKTMIGLASSCVMRAFLPCHTKTAIDISGCRPQQLKLISVDSTLLLFLHLYRSAASIALNPEFHA